MQHPEDGIGSGSVAPHTSLLLSSGPCPSTGEFGSFNLVDSSSTSTTFVDQHTPSYGIPVVVAPPTQFQIIQGGTVFSTSDVVHVVEDASSLPPVPISVPVRAPSPPPPPPAAPSVVTHKEDALLKPIGRGPYSCRVCLKEFAKIADFKKHEKSHLEDRRYRCSQCSASFNVEKNLLLHKAGAHQSSVLECPDCQRTFNRIASFKSHLTIHQEEDNLACPLCEAEFPNETYLTAHIKSHEESAQIQQKEPSSESKYACRFCKKSMPSYSYLQRHYAEHAKVRKLVKLKQRRRKNRASSSKSSAADAAVGRGGGRNKCKFCSKTFKKPSQCLRHERIHTGEKPFKCTECSKSFNQKNSLDIHLRKHTGSKPFVCEICQVGFSQTGNLRTHILRVHSMGEGGENTFNCDECPCSFRRVGSLNAHISKHHVKENNGTAKCDVQPRNGNDDLLSKAIVATGGISSSSTGEEKENSNLTSVVLAARDKEGNVRKHLIKCRLENGVRYLLCNVCSQEFRKPSSLSRHILSYHNLDKPYKCKKCSRAFNLKSTYLAHLRIHNSQMSYFCDICFKTFHSTTSFKAHQQLHGLKVLPAAAAEGGTGTAAAATAKLLEHQEPYVLTDQGEILQPHNRLAPVYLPTHKEQLDRAYKCSTCPARFKKSSHLREHQRIHTGEKPFQCQKCDRSFTSKSTLTSHERRHELAEREEKGEGDPQAAGSKTNPMENLKCGQCEQIFSNASSLKRHFATHSDLKPFICPYCTRTFKSNVLCKKHIRTHQNQQLENQAHEKQQLLTQPLPQRSLSINQDIKDPFQQAKNASAEDSSVVASISADGVISIDPTQLRLAMSSSDGLQMQLEPHPPSAIGQVAEPIENSVGNQLNLTTFQDSKQQLMSNSQQLPSVFGALANADQETNLPSSHVLYSCTNCNAIFQSVEAVEDHVAQQLCGDQQATNSVAPPSTLESNQKLPDQIPPSLSLSEILPHSSHRVSMKDKESSPSNSLKNKKRNSAHDDKSKSNKTISEALFEATLGEEESLIKNNSKTFVPEQTFRNKCSLCPKSFKKPSDLTRHVRTHTGEKPFPCPQCAKRFSLKSTLESHLKTHSTARHVLGGGELKCHVCQVGFSGKSALKTHMRIHSGSKPFKCPYCDETFRTSGLRKGHLSSVHQVTSSNLNKENETHHQSVKIIPETESGILDTAMSTIPQLQQEPPYSASELRKGLVVSSILTKENVSVIDSNKILPGQQQQPDVELLDNAMTSMTPLHHHQAPIPPPPLPTVSSSNSIRLSVPSASLTQALDAVQSVGVPLLGSTVRLQLDGNGLGGAVTHLQVDAELLDQLQKGGNIDIVVDSTSLSDISTLQPMTGVSQQQQQPMMPAQGSGNPAEVYTVQDEQLVRLGNDTALMAAVADGHQQIPQQQQLQLQQQFGGGGGGEGLACSWCDQVLLTESDRNEHLLDVHGYSNTVAVELGVSKVATAAPGPTKIPGSDNTCQTCGKKFSKPSLLERHQRIHTGEKPFSCPLCNRGFNQKNALQVHLKKHTGERPFVCPFCDFAFTQKCNLKTHIHRSHAQQAQQLLSETRKAAEQQQQEQAATAAAVIVND